MEGSKGKVEEDMTDEKNHIEEMLQNLDSDIVLDWVGFILL